MASHHPGRPKVVAAVLGVLTGLSAVSLAGAGYAAAPTHSQISLALVGSVLAGCLAAWAGLADRRKQKEADLRALKKNITGITLSATAALIAVQGWDGYLTGTGISAVAVSAAR